MNEEQLKALTKQVGEETAQKIVAETALIKTRMEAIATGSLTKEEFTAFDTANKEALKELKDIAAKQGTTLQEILDKMTTTSQTEAKMSIVDRFKADETELKELASRGMGNKQYMVTCDAQGKFYMEPYDPTTRTIGKAAGPHATIGGVGGGGNTASVTQTVDAASILRMGANATIVGTFRNLPFLFPVVNLINAGMDKSTYQYWDEQARQGAPGTVAEGGSKPLVQAAYALRSVQYKKVAMLLNFTEEFDMDFQALQSDIVNKSQTDLLNLLNSNILANLITNATAYNTAASYGSGANGVANPNDWDAIAAMAAQVENSTYGIQANAALMSTFKKYRLGTEKAVDSGVWLNAPQILQNIALVSNPSLGADQIIVGDLTNYNVALRGGIIVKVGYNGTDFAENKFSTVIEQYYYDWISANRTSAIVKGPNFADVKTAITFAA